MTTLLTALVILYLLQGLAKFAVHFLVPYEKRIKKIGDYYRRDASTIRLFDNVSLGLMAILVVLLLLSGSADALSFATALVVGMTLMQLFFHRFTDALPPDKAPDAPVRPAQLMSFAIQARPQLAWREYVFMTVLLGGATATLIAQTV